MGRLWINKPPSVHELAVALDLPVHECSGTLFFGGEMPPSCRTVYMQPGNGTFDPRLGYHLYTFAFNDGPALISTVGQPGGAQFTDHGLQCIFWPLMLETRIVEHFSCSPPVIFSATYRPDGTSDLWLLENPRHAVQGGITAIAALFCIGYVLDHGRRLTRHVPLAELSKYERTVVADIVTTVCTSTVYDLLLLREASFHPLLSVVADGETLAMLALLFAATIAINASLAILIATPVTSIDWLLPGRRGSYSRVLNVLCRFGYEAALLQSLVVLAPALVAPYYHTLLQFLIGIAVLFLCGRDFADIVHEQPDRATVLVAGVILVPNVAVGGVCLLPNLIACDAIPPWVELTAAATAGVQALVLGYKSFSSLRVTRITT